MSTERERNDLTRWNRAGLSRFRYIDGNAINFLEEMRLALIEQYNSDTSSPQWSDLGDAIQDEDETTREKLDRLIEQFYGERKDYAWEIVRTFVRSIHILTEYTNAYANERYLGTSTQWENVRRLVDVLNYSPTPPASAATKIAILSKDDISSATVKAGLQIKDKPEDGSSPSIFETLEDLVVDEDLNKLRAKNWNKSQETFSYTQSGSDYYATFPLDKALDDISQNSRCVLVVSEEDGGTVVVERGLPVSISAVSDDELTLKGKAAPAAFSFPYKRHQLKLLYQADKIQTPKLSGSDVIELEDEHNLTADGNTAIAWQESSTWYGAKVVSVDGLRLSLTGGISGHKIPPEGVEVYRLTLANRQTDGSNLFAIPKAADRETSDVWYTWLGKVSSSLIEPVYADDAETVIAYDELSLSASYNQVYYLPEDTESSGTVESVDVQELEFAGDPGDLATDDWVVMDDGSTAVARQIESIDQKEESYVLTLSGPDLSNSSNYTMYALFKESVYPEDYDENNNNLYGSEIFLDTVPDALEKDRKIIFKNANTAFASTITSVETGSIKIDPALPVDVDDEDVDTATYLASNDADFNYHDTIIYANVVNAGHGETKPDKILGSGDNTKLNQNFLFKTKDIAFVTDTTMSSGVAAAISVVVDGRTWTQVSTLNDSSAYDAHYTVRMTEEGYLKISFGDGEYGRRLPTGSNNVRIKFREGTGLSGNVKAGALTKIVKKNQYVDSVVQALAASGGSDMEEVDSLKENAPASVLTLERAVSLTDFTNLTVAHSSVWQAKAFSQPTGFGRHDSVNIIVIPSGGGALGDLKDTLSDYLENYTLPGVDVTISDYEAVPLDLEITIRVIFDEYDKDTVKDNVKSALETQLSLKKCKLGEAFFRSTLFNIVENVTGVENSDCVISDNTLKTDDGTDITVLQVARGKDNVIRSILPDSDQILYIDDDDSSVTITVKEFSL